MLTFKQRFGFEPEVVARAPGRVNILGEHTDYNDGFVLPMAIRQTTCVEIARSDDDRCRFYSANLDYHASRSAEACAEYRAGDVVPAGYARYVDGCIQVLRRRGFPVPPLFMAIRSDVPIGVGLSSSAALEVATLRGLRQLLSLPLDDLELARAAQEAEIRFAGVHCGIMDQVAASVGDPGRMLYLDTRTLQWQLLPLPDATEIVVLDSGVPRTLAGGIYNFRRTECEAAARQLGIRALRDCSDPAVADRLPPPLDRRARHVITENNRVVRAAAGVDARTFGSLMSDSHRSLREDFEVSIRELDVLVEILQAHPAVYGGRLTGAGFGGACVALVSAGSAAAVKSQTLQKYAHQGYRGTALI